MTRGDLGRAPAAWTIASLVLALAAVLQVAVETGGPGLPPGIFRVLIALAATLPLGLLPPRTAAAIMTAAGLISIGLEHDATVAGPIALVAAAYRLGSAGAQALAGCVSVAVVVVALAQSANSPTRVLLCLLAGAVPLMSWAGYAQRVRTESAVRSAQDDVMAGTLVAHTVRGERARIARELHDVVAHHISMIAVQAETTRLTTQGMPPAGAQRLQAIGDTARSALTEMRRLLGVLRADAADEVAERHPQPGLGQLNDLVDAARQSSGAGTRLIVSGWPAPLDPGVELAAYRIVQEALTNARRHAPGAAVDVEVQYRDDGLRLRIRDNGPGPPGSSDAAGSHGLLGMRERAAAVGGTLSTGLAPGGGFIVEAALPAKTEQDAA